MSNRLHLSNNPYLRQHKDNPVHWQEWGTEAWEQAERENKPVFLSIGYSTCHWCHVMAHESFEDRETADVLNTHFVNIKLDREERPDIDDLFMTATQLATGHGGWPLSIFLTPDKKPIFAGTYFPKEGRQGVPSFVTILNALASAWRDEEAEVRSKAEEFAQGLESVLEKGVAPVSTQIDPGLLDQAIQHFHGDYDYEKGGFGSEPKFPPHATIEFLIRYAQTRHHLVGDVAIIENLTGEASMMAFQTLEEMAKGGIRDHLRGGFHRYTVDEEWHLPHFEKMLYDNAQMIRNYALAARAVDVPELSTFFQEVVDQTVDFVQREMMTEEGLFLSALDADSDGEEGAYYVWSWQELESNLGDSMGEVAELYGLNERGNFSDEATGIPIPKNILHLQAVARRHPALDRLMVESESRARPFVDDKRIFGLNGLMISALARAGYLDLATKCASNWLKITDDALYHQIGSTSPPFLDDIAYFTDALLDLHVQTSDPKWKEAAESLADRMIEHFSCESGGFYFTSTMHEKLYSRTIPAMDNAMPSPNGVAVRVLRRLGRQEEALRHLTAIYGWAQRLPGASSTILLECLEQLLIAEGELRLEGAKSQPSAEIEFDPREVIVGEDGFGYSKVIIRIPKDLHINSHSPGAHWLTPTTVRIDGVYGEAGFPDAEHDRYEDEVEIHLRLKAKTRTDEFELSVTYQLCSESECYLAQEARFAGVLIAPGD